MLSIFKNSMLVNCKNFKTQHATIWQKTHYSLFTKVYNKCKHGKHICKSFKLMCLFNLITH